MYGLYNHDMYIVHVHVYTYMCILQVNSGVRMTGTAWWMAPELVPGGKQSDAASEKSDVW